jgi:hypothetical protein
MALSNKEAAMRTIEQLPDDASLDDIKEALTASDDVRANHQIITGVAASENDAEGVALVGDSQPVRRRLVKKGFVTVLEPTRPLPPVSVDLVNYIIEQMRREREDRFLGLTEDDR